MITYERIHSGAVVLSALVYDRNGFGSPFRHSCTFYGYGRREATDLFRDSLTRDGLVIVDD